MVDMDAFARRLTMLMVERGETQMALAEAIDGDNVSISRYVTRRALPRMDTLVKIADHFDVSIDYLVGRSDVRAVARYDDGGSC